MTDMQRKRHTVKPGLSGLAQVQGRNAISWERKIEYDLEYIEKISFSFDLKILLQTVKKVFLHSSSKENSREIDVTDDYGDYLLKNGKITKEEYDRKLQEARLILHNRN